MTFRFNQLLLDAGVKPENVRLLRHQTPLPGGRTPADLLLTDRAAFDYYQSLQLTIQRAHFARPFWASFVGLRDGRTMFAGLYAAASPVPVEQDFLFLTTGEQCSAGSHDRYTLTLLPTLEPYTGRLYIDWGGGTSGKRAWKQRAELQDKRVTELLLDGAEKPFPGLMALVEPLSAIMEAPSAWGAQLAAARGVYLLTCPRTGEVYVGSATGTGGFWSRWTSYAADGHGGNIALIGREPSDWRVSILQVAGSADTTDDILAMEALWKRKFLSRKLGLNRN